MPFMGRAYVLFAAIVLVTMAARIGWIDWHLIATSTAKLVTNVLVVLILAALLIGAPALILITFLKWLLKPTLAAAAPTVEAPR